MRQRSSNNWKFKSGSWDALNTDLISFDEDYPSLGSFSEVQDFDVSICNDYKSITERSLISTFVDDYILERYWNNPNKYIGYYRQAKYILSPDFSILVDMPKPMQMWNVYRNRFVGYIWQSAGLNVIPTISWGCEKSFDFCFEGVKEGSIVAVSNIGCITQGSKEYFDAGFEKMKEVIKPKQIIFQCNKKYKEHYKNEMIIFVDSYWDKKRKQLKNI